jgi:hypothetical protein
MLSHRFHLSADAPDSSAPQANELRSCEGELHRLQCLQGFDSRCSAATGSARPCKPDWILRHGGWRFCWRVFRGRGGFRARNRANGENIAQRSRRGILLLG